MFESSTDRDLAELIGTALPADAGDVHYHHHQPSTDLSLHVVYAKLRTSRDGYLALVARMGLTRYPGSAPELRTRLPGAWQLWPTLTLAWWTPTPAIPDDTAQRLTDGSDFTVMKYEHGYAYLVQQAR